MKRTLFYAAVAAICGSLFARPSEAGIVVGLVLDPFASSGGAGDLGNWQLFALDDSSIDFGISSYNIDLVGATTIHNASPFATGIQDADGNTYQAGFNLLRSPSGLPNGDTIHASQSLPGQSPFLITGMGQESGDFASKVAAAQPGATVSPGGSASSWGNYNSIAPLNGKNWLLLADGSYNRSAPPTIARADFTVFTDNKNFRSSFSQSSVVPEPITPTLLTPEYLAHLTPPTVTPPAVPPTPVPSPGAPGPNVPPSGGTPPANSHLNGNGIVVGMVLNPAAAGAQNTWQLFAVDTNANDFGISSYSVKLSGASSIRHTSASGAVQDADGNTVDAGFNLLRGVEHSAQSDWIHASQGLPDQGSMLITGFGQEASGFAAKASAHPGATALSQTTWGNYDGMAPLDGKNWLMLAQGTYDPAAPPKIDDASFTVFSDDKNFRSAYSAATIVPEAITPGLLTSDYLAKIAPPAPVTPPPAPIAPRTPPAPAGEPVLGPFPPKPDQPPVTEPQPQPIEGAPPVVIAPPTQVPPPVEAPPVEGVPPTEGPSIEPPVYVIRPLPVEIGPPVSMPADPINPQPVEGALDLPFEPPHTFPWIGEPIQVILQPYDPGNIEITLTDPALLLDGPGGLLPIQTTGFWDLSRTWRLQRLIGEKYLSLTEAEPIKDFVDSQMLFYKADAGRAHYNDRAYQTAVAWAVEQITSADNAPAPEPSAIALLLIAQSSLLAIRRPKRGA